MSVGSISEQRAVSDADGPATAKVLLLNDDETTMEFVVHVLESVFSKTREEALRLVLEIDRDGRGECGVYAVGRASDIAALARTGQAQGLSSAVRRRTWLSGCLNLSDDAMCHTKIAGCHPAPSAGDIAQ